MKKYLLIVLGLLSLLVLTSCANAKDLSDYVDVSFSGVNTKGKISYSIDLEKLLLDEANNDRSKAMSNLEELAALDGAYKIVVDKTDNLSNGDKVKVVVTVDENKTKKYKSGEKVIEVEGLEEAKRITTKDVEQHLVLNFNGVSGRGVAKIDNVFDSPLNSVKFTVENDGQLKNGDKAKIVLSKQDEESLLQMGYLPEEGFNPTFEVKGLKIVAANAKDIANLADIERMIDEGIKRKYQDFYAEYSYGYRFEIQEEKEMYRQFKKESEASSSAWTFNGTDNGNLIKVFTVKKYTGGAETKLDSTNTVIFGFTDIMLDAENKANVSELKEIKDVKDDTYSLESVIKLYEGYGYSEVK